MNLKHLKIFKKAAYAFKPKCFNGIKEIVIESDGRAILCQQGERDGLPVSNARIADYDNDLKLFMNSAEIRGKRLNCQTCTINCGDTRYFEPAANNFVRALLRLLGAFTVAVAKEATAVPLKIIQKFSFLSKPKCLSGIKELIIEADGRAVICQMGTYGNPALTAEKIGNFNYDLKQFFNSREVRNKRLNCQRCYLNCQQDIYFEPKADNPFKIMARMMKIPGRVLKDARDERKKIS